MGKELEKKQNGERVFEIRRVLNRRSKETKSEQWGVPNYGKLRRIKRRGTRGIPKWAWPFCRKVGGVSAKLGIGQLKKRRAKREGRDGEEAPSAPQDSKNIGSPQPTNRFPKNSGSRVKNWKEAETLAANGGSSLDFQKRLVWELMTKLGKAADSGALVRVRWGGRVSKKVPTVSRRSETVWVKAAGWRCQGQKFGNWRKGSKFEKRSNWNLKILDGNFLILIYLRPLQTVFPRIHI